MTQPAERVGHTPSENTTSVHHGGTPPAAIHSPHQVGHSSSSQPIGRSPRVSFQYRPSRSRQGGTGAGRSEEHTSELQSLMRNSYAVFCLKKKKKKPTKKHNVAPK